MLARSGFPGCSGQRKACWAQFPAIIMVRMTSSGSRNTTKVAAGFTKSNTATDVQ